jgi:hypothetical protein
MPAKMTIERSMTSKGGDGAFDFFLNQKASRSVPPVSQLNKKHDPEPQAERVIAEKTERVKITR